MAYGLIQKVADCSTERPCEDEGAPKEEHARDVRPQVKSGKSGQPCSEDERTSLMASVVAAILMIQKAKVTSGTLLKRNSGCRFRSLALCWVASVKGLFMKSPLLRFGRRSHLACS